MVGALCLVRPRCIWDCVSFDFLCVSSTPAVPGPLNAVFPMIVAMFFGIPRVFGVVLSVTRLAYLLF